MMELTEAKIQKLIFTTFADRAIVVPNCHYQNCRWECDVLVVTPAGLTYEYEIKLNCADLKAERKHKVVKHRYMDTNIYAANYYSFVCPADVITLKDVWDDRYGLFYADGYYLKPIRKPTKINDYRVDEKYYRRLAKKLMFKYFNHADKFQVRKGVR